ncbi:hypothetical protein BJB45_17940 [Halomonas huangheensis]|uniref:Uncharacterized protein n=1 Tax=Halomonas huangheensis TaxID=1178482 RepID=W1NCE6_9GAMM|nr:hypothetical protein AR456_11985 [Halomonas huangheensis]ERL53158.1 hypothetical protein BJB45_17940 [Halomonas huangheensis]
MWCAWTEEDKISFFLKRNFLIWKKQHEMTANKDIEGPDGVSWRPLMASFTLGMRVPLQFHVFSP